MLISLYAKVLLKSTILFNKNNDFTLLKKLINPSSNRCYGTG